MKKLFAPLVILAFAGCSSFDTDYSKLVDTKDAANQPVAGPWIGRWQSEAGHGGGELRAVITGDGKSGPMVANQNYTAHFKAKWGFMTSEYSAPVTTTTDLKKISTAAFHIETDLGAMVGKYSMDGESTPATFTGTYKSDHDHGTIDLKRP